MPSVEFDQKNKVQDEGSFPRLKLEMNESVRILCVEKTPHYEYTHRLTKPRIVGGKPEYKTRKNRDGTEYTSLENDFISQPFCLGDLGVLQDKGLDVKNCPVCAASVDSEWVKAPERRFAMNVFKYTLAPGHNFNVADPFGGSIIAWVFGEKVFNRLADLASEWGGLQNNDLNLGPLTQAPAMYQKFDISVAADAAFRRNEANQKYLVAAYKTGKCDDLKKLTGRSVPTDFLRRDLEEIKNAHQAVKAYESGHTPVDPADTGGVDLTAGLDELLDTPADGAVPVGEASFRDLAADVEPPAPAAPSEAPEGSLDALLDGGAPVASQEPPAKAAPPAVTLDFEDLLAQTE
jgi:hypothetical protein